MEIQDLQDGADLFTTNGKDIWRVKYWCNEPTVTLKNLDTGEEIGGAVYSRNIQPFVKMIPEREIKGE